MKTIFDYLEEIAGKQKAQKTPCDCGPVLVDIVDWDPNEQKNAKQNEPVRVYFACYFNKTAGEIWDAYTSGKRIRFREEYDGGVEYDVLLSAAIVDGTYNFVIVWEGALTIFSAPSASAYPGKRIGQ